MIIYKPISELEKLKDIFSSDLFDNNYVYGGYYGIEEDGVNVGKCLFKMINYKCYVVAIDCDFTDKLLVEGFLRSALNYCANRNAYMCYCEIADISDVLSHLGFENNNGVYSGDIPSLLKGCCCK